MPITPTTPLKLDQFELYESTEEIKEVVKFHIKILS